MSGRDLGVGDILERGLHHAQGHTERFGSGVQLGAGPVGELSRCDLANGEGVRAPMGKVFPLGAGQFRRRAEQLEDLDALVLSGE